MHKGTKCMGCGVKNIKGVLFRCLVCQMGWLCRMCWEGLEHPEHEKWIMKKESNGQWVMAPQRNGMKNMLPVYKSVRE